MIMTWWVIAPVLWVPVRVPVARIVPPVVKYQPHKQMFHVKTWEA